MKDWYLSLPNTFSSKSFSIIGVSTFCDGGFSESNKHLLNKHAVT